MLRICNLSVNFGGLKALSQVSLEVTTGEIHSIIGPNGAGKTTLFNAITGITPIAEGTIFLEEERIDGKRPHIICRLGAARTFQNLRLFRAMSVLDNVLVADEARVGATPIFPSTMLCLPSALRSERAARDRAVQLLESVGLVDKLSRAAGELSYGDQRRLEIARAIATRPKVLLLDEPAAGMNPKEMLGLTEFISGLPNLFDVTILLIEHQMKLVMNLSSRVSVFDSGKHVFTGIPQDVRQHPEVIRVYLGGQTAERALDLRSGV